MEHKSDFIETLKILDGVNLLEHLILIGSWAEYLYEAGSVIKDFVSTTKTTDIDFLVRNIRKPREKVRMFEVFEENGFITDFKHNGVVVFRKGDFEVEFLARQIGKPVVTVDSVNYGKIETLKHMSVINNNLITIDYEGMNICIPNPVSFVLHKMIINKDRGDKKEKDTVAIKNLLFYIEDDDNYSKQFKEVYSELTKKEVGYVKDYCQSNNIDLEDDYGVE